MTRDELIQDGCDALPLVVWRELTMENVVEYVLDAVEPTIRADEEARVAFYLARKQSDDLRAQVKAMYDSRPVKNTAYTQALADVLALLDGSSDD